MIKKKMRLLRPDIRETRTRLLGDNRLLADRRALSLAGVAAMVVLTVTAGVTIRLHTRAASAVPGQSYLICDNPGTYLTSPWTYHALGSGSQQYTVAQYQALSGYGTTLPPLPSYIASEPSGTTAAVIFAPGSTDVNAPAYAFPGTPVLYFFEGGAYPILGLQSISGDEFIGGSASGYPEPKFDDANGAGGIGANNDTYSYSGASNTLTGTFSAGATTVTTTSAISAYAAEITFSDGSTYSIAGGTATSVQLGSPLTSSESGTVWTNSTNPIGKVSAAKAQGATTVTVTSMNSPLVQWGHVVLGAQDYGISSITGTESGGYTLTIANGLDKPVAANTPVYYGTAAAGAGGVTVSYLEILHDLHVTTGTITPGQGWEVSHNYIHDSYRNPGEGVGYYGGDESVLEYNCFDKLGNYAGGGDGTNSIMRYNEVKNTPYSADPGCGCSGVGKWWGSLNADITDNAFVDDGEGEGQPVIWLDNGNSGTNISGNYFDHNQGTAVESETGFNLSVTGNLFQDNNWGTGNGCGDSNCVGAVNLNSSGGFHVPNSRYDNQVIINGNQFVNNWGGVTIWESGLRNCESSGEGWPTDAAYCTGGFPTTATAGAGGQYYFSHLQDSQDGGEQVVDQNANAGSTTLLVRDAEAINDQIGFADESVTNTTSSNNVTTLSGSQSINAADTSGFPSSGQLRVDTSTTGGGGGLTGAILSYTGKTATSFTGVSFVRGSGTLDGPIRQVQPYKVTAETCYANDCQLTISPGLASNVSAGSDVAASGTCALFATGAALPTGPLAPNGTSYYDGCQWGTKHISITNNDFSFDPAYIASHAPLSGGATTTTCTAAHANECGTNFMMMQSAGSPPWGTNIDGNAMFSNTSFTTCPSWDPGCTTDPLNNLNALSNAPGAPGNNGEAASNNLWNNNTYEGPWAFNAFNYGPCNALPVDPNTGHAMPTSPDPCNQLDFAHWQSYWQQDSASTYSATVTPTPSTTPTPTPTPSGTPAGKIGDLNNDNQVNVFDLSILLSNWATSNAVADLNHDNTVNVFDLSILLSHWGT